MLLAEPFGLITSVVISRGGRGTRAESPAFQVNLMIIPTTLPSNNCKTGKEKGPREGLRESSHLTKVTIPYGTEGDRTVGQSKMERWKQ